MTLLIPIPSPAIASHFNNLHLCHPLRAHSPASAPAPAPPRAARSLMVSRYAARLAAASRRRSSVHLPRTAACFAAASARPCIAKTNTYGRVGECGVGIGKERGGRARQDGGLGGLAVRTVAALCMTCHQCISSLAGAGEGRGCIIFFSVQLLHGHHLHSRQKACGHESSRPSQTSACLSAQTPLPLASLPSQAAPLPPQAALCPGPTFPIQATP